MPEALLFLLGGLTGSAATAAVTAAKRARRRRRWDLERAVARDRALRELGRLITTTPRTREDQPR